MPTFGSLFAGIGGFDLGFEKAGWTCSWQVELDLFCRHILERHWPKVLRHGDVRTWPTPGAPEVDAIVGGFPCQPVSQAGLKKAQKDPRWLWPEFARVIGAMRPKVVVIENVLGLRHRGLRDVLVDLAGLGFDAEWSRLSAQGVGAPHRRQRIFIVASDPKRTPTEAAPGWLGRAFREAEDRFGYCPVQGSVADARGERLEKREGDPEDSEQELEAAEGGGPPVADARSQRLARERSAQAARGFQGPQRDLALGLFSRPWHVEPNVGRVVDGVPSRVDRLKSLGNAVVPQATEVVARALGEAIPSLGRES